ncbi:MAG TPA: 4-hydroxy-2-oxovalerate aldolase [Peptococcaceae bacterium]|nr:4-hydroxy-2-oxovalerate aldolase [Peptococcaceae bacterium]
MAKIKIFDLTLRDGSHAKSHQFTPEQMAILAEQIDKTGVEAIEFGHGNGLGGNALQYGFAAASDREYMEAVAPVIKNSSISIIILPGVGTRHELNLAKEFGAKYARLCTQITEVDIAEQHIKMAKQMGFIPISVLPCAGIIPVKDTVRYAQMAESYGAEVIYLLDGGGYQLPEQTYERIAAMKKAVDVPIGFHGHNNLQLAVANSKAAVEAGAEYIDCCLKGFGAGAGNCPTEIFAAVLDRMNIDCGIDLYKTMDIAEEYLRPLMPRPMEVDNDRIMLGYAGCYSSFLLFAQRAGAKFGVDPRDIIKEIGRRQCTEGQEDICIDVAYALANKKANK